jgi:hypothetical protein
MKENDLNSAQDDLDAPARTRAAVASAPGDRLMLADATLLAALDGTRPLTPNERQALSASPLTLRRFRQLSLERHAAAMPAMPTIRHGPAVRHGARRHGIGDGSTGRTQTDGYWTLHFLPQDAAGR